MARQHAAPAQAAPQQDDDERPANMMRAVNVPLISTGCRNARAMEVSTCWAKSAPASIDSKDSIL